MNNNIQDQIDSVTSFPDILYLLTQSSSGYLVNGNYKVNKIFSFGLNQFELKLNNTCDIKNNKLTCFYGRAHRVSIDHIIRDLPDETKMNARYSSYIGFIINDDTRRWNEGDKFVLAEKYASFASSLFDAFPNGKRFEVALTHTIKRDNNFLVYILEKMDLNKIEEIALIHLYDIIEYFKQHQFSESNIIKKTPNLKKFTLDIQTSDRRYEVLDENDNILKQFLNCLRSNKNVTLELCAEDNNDSLNIAFKILEYADQIHLNVSIFLKAEWNENMITSDYSFTNESLRILTRLVTTDIFINEVDDLKILSQLFIYGENVKCIIIHIDKAVIIEIWNQFDTIEEYIEYASKNFYFKNTISKLDKVILFLGSYNYSDNRSERIFELEVVYNTFLDTFISILPNTVHSIFFNNFISLPQSFFDKLSSHLKFLRTLSFLKTSNIPFNAFMKLSNLRSIIIHGEIKTVIPDWIKIVMFCYFENEYYEGFSNTSSEITNNHYFELMNRSFGHSLRYLNQDDIYFIGFLENISLWKEMFLLADERF